MKHSMRSVCVPPLLLCFFTPSVLPARATYHYTKLLPDAEDHRTGKRFANSVALDGNYALAGHSIGYVSLNPENSVLSGSAYVFDKSSGSTLKRLVPDDPGPRDRFGSAVAINNGIALIGAPGEDEERGSAYLYDASTGSKLHKLLADDGTTWDRFGSSVSLDEGVAIIGSVRKRTAYLFDTLTGNQIRKLASSDAAPFDNTFGTSVAIQGDRAIVGAPLSYSHDYLDDPLLSPEVGSAYIFDTTTGEQLHRLAPPNGMQRGSNFGASVSIRDGIALIGAPYDRDNGWNSGAAYLFDVATGEQLAKISPNDPTANQSFGWQVAIGDGLALVGAPEVGTTPKSGSAYLFDLDTYTQQAKLTPSDAMQGDFFGSAIAITDQAALIGAQLHDEIGNNTGSAYLFKIVPEPSTTALLCCAAAIVTLCRRRTLVA